MSDKFFVDSNVFVYLLGNDERKKRIALELLSKKPVTSVQVINENVNVALKKIKADAQVAIGHATKLLTTCRVKPISKQVVFTAFEVLKKYRYSWYDCLIIASALENNCTILYSEDLQHNQLISQRLRIINPFISPG